MALFETPRLAARRLTLNDVPALLAVYGDRETVRFVGEGEPLSQADAARWVAVTDANFARRRYGMVALVERATGEVVGFAGIVHPGGQPEAEIKYAFRRDRWGQGLATEAVGTLLAHARSAWGVRRVIATVHPGNGASQGVLAKLGFVRAPRRVEEDGSMTEIWESANSGMGL